MITLASIIERFGADYLAQYPQCASHVQRQALTAMQRCRTTLAPRMLAQCTDCGDQKMVPHSCGHRHCPHCQAHESQSWIERQTTRLVPSNYFLLTFTLPSELRTRFQEQGDAQALAEARALVESSGSLSSEDRERLMGFLEGSRKMILSEPKALLTEASRLPGIDGQKMSKSYGNSIAMREDPASVTKKLRTMPTDPARVRRTDPGEPSRCPVFALHQVYSSEDTRQWVQQGCRSAGIGCLDCKQPVIDAVIAEQAPFIERAQPFLDDPRRLQAIIDAGCDKARAVAQETMRDVREVMGLNYRSLG
jgi:tryptophanyl-tRNA synthetase